MGEYGVPNKGEHGVPEGVSTEYLRWGENGVPNKISTEYQSEHGVPNRVSMGNR